MSNSSSKSSSNSYFPKLDQPPPLSKSSLLPIIERCSTYELPSGPFQAADCKARWIRHQEQQDQHEEIGGESAVDFEDETETPTAESLSQEFVVPFFIQLPISKDLKSDSIPHSRRASSSSLSRPTFRLTPLPSNSSPSLKPDSPISTKSQPIGFLRPEMVRALLDDNKRMVSMNCQLVWSFLPPIVFEKSIPSRRPSGNWTSRPSSRRNSQSATPETGGANGEKKDLKEALMNLKVGNGEAEDIYAVGFESWVNEGGNELRSEHLDRICRGFKMNGQFADQLDGWRDEHYNIYGPISEKSNTPGSNVAFKLERAACSLFGVCTFGVHLIAYLKPEGEEMQIWVPKRSATKQTWPSALDNTAAGGITAGELPRESIIRECEEEASLHPTFVSKHIKATSVVIYTTRTPLGWISPEVQYVYDLQLPSDGSIVPSTNPADGEVESFTLMGVTEVIERALAGEFKPNCGMVVVDFLVRHGYVSFETDGRYLEVVSQLRRTLTLPGPI